MAKIKFGAVITDSRGHIGGHSFKWSRYGNIMLRTPQPTKTQSPFNTRVRSHFVQFSKSWWSELTPTQRDGWRSLAAANPRPNVWGDEFPITGLAYYLMLNTRLSLVDEPVLLDAPADQAVTSLATLSIAASAPSTLALTFTASPTPADHRLYLFATPPLSPGITNFDGKYLFLGAAPLATSSPYAAGSLYTARCGDLFIDRQVAVRAALLNTDNGALSPFIIATDIVT
jgi:hypothetical protein